MTYLIIDEDWSKADPVALAAAGYHGVIGYVSQDTGGKNLPRADVDAAHAAGLSVGLVYEYWAQSALGGAGQGISDAGIAIAHARQLGAPTGVCLYTAIDWNVTDAQLPTVLAYARAFQTACVGAGYRAGAYGSYAVCQYLATHGWSGLLWQTYAWSNSQWWAGAAVRQEANGVHLAGAVVDQDEAMVPDWGQWEAEMAAFFDDANAAALAWRVDALHQGTDTVQGGPTAGEPMWLVQAVKDIQAKLGTAPALTLSDADVTRLAAAVATAHPGLTEADQPVIEAALRDVLHAA